MALVSLHLHALKYPEAEAFDAADPAKYRALVLWLEHTKIRHYTLEAREGLAAADTDAWATAFSSYLSDLGCPATWNGDSNALPVLKWLLNHATSLEFADAAAEHNAAAATAVAAAPAPADWTLPPVPPYADAASPEVLATLRQVLESLRVSLDPGAGVTSDELRCARGVVEAQVLPCLAAARTAPGGVVSPAAVLEGLPLGFSTGDAGVDLAATVLRMLHIKDMRELQDQVDAAIVRLQEVTANPRTDAAAGRVGR